MKKIMIVLGSIFILSVSGCAYKTCPTYTKKIKKNQKEHVINDQVQIQEERNS